MSLRILPDSVGLAEAIADRIFEVLTAALKARGSASIVLAGGSTYHDAYARLGTVYGSKLDWEKVSFYFGDERCVSPEDERSNYGQAKRYLLDVLPVVRPPHVLWMETEDDCEEASQRYADLLPDRFDLVLLGLGPDGHAASLFPGSLAHIREGALTAVTQAELPPLVKRITLTPLALSRGEHVLVAASGAAKSPIVARILRQGYSSAVGLVKPLSGELEWLLDAEAGGSLA